MQRDQTFLQAQRPRWISQNEATESPCRMSPIIKYENKVWLVLLFTFPNLNIKLIPKYELQFRTKINIFAKKCCIWGWQKGKWDFGKIMQIKNSVPPIMIVHCEQSKQMIVHLELSSLAQNQIISLLDMDNLVLYVYKF